MTIINPQKEYWPSRGSNQRPTVLKSASQPTELWGSAHRPRNSRLAINENLDNQQVLSVPLSKIIDFGRWQRLRSGYTKRAV